MCTWHIFILFLCDHQLFSSITNLLLLVFFCLLIYRKIYISDLDLIACFQNINKVIEESRIVFLLTVQYLAFITIKIIIFREARKSGGRAGLFLIHHYVQKVSNIPITWHNTWREGTKTFFFFFLFPEHWFKGLA